MVTKKKRLPKYRWWVLTPHHHVTGQLPYRHAVGEIDHPNGDVVAICGGEGAKEAFELRGPKTIEKHPVCGRCELVIERIKMMIGS